MKYMGSKARIAKYILPIILKDRAEGQWYIEPFCGGCNTLDKVTGNRIGCDVNGYLIEMFKALQNGWFPPKIVTEEMYDKCRLENKHDDVALSGYIGFSMSFGGKFFGGYRRDEKGTAQNAELKKKNEETQSRRSFSNLKKQKDLLSDVHFFHKSYSDLTLTKPCVIYCDPPYEGTTGYKTGAFDHAKFWQWCRDMTNEGHQVFISEYNAPEDFTCVWEMDISNTVSRNAGKKATEKLFIYNKR